MHDAWKHGSHVHVCWKLCGSVGESQLVAVSPFRVMPLWILLACGEISRFAPSRNSDDDVSERTLKSGCNNFLAASTKDPIKRQALCLR